MSEAAIDHASASASRVVLLAPATARVPDVFADVAHDEDRHGELLGALQRLRASVYLADDAISAAEVDSERRHRQASDPASWHLLALDERDGVQGCLRYHVHAADARFDDLALSRSALARCPRWGRALRGAVERELAEARADGRSFVELGGWAIAPEARARGNGARLVIASYALARAMGGCVGVATATARHASASILRGLGGHGLACEGVALPAYYDAHHGCEMQAIRFDSEIPDADLAQWVDGVGAELVAAPVVWAQPARRDSYTQLVAARPGALASPARRAS